MECRIGVVSSRSNVGSDMVLTSRLGEKGGENKRKENMNAMVGGIDRC